MKRYIRSNAICADRSNPKQKSVYVSQEYVQGYGWEDITVYDDTSAESYRLAKQDEQDYRSNGFGARVITRKIDNPNYSAPEITLSDDAIRTWIDESNYEVQEVSRYNYHLNSNDTYYGVQVLWGDNVESRGAEVFNVRTNRTKTVYSMDELANSVESMLSKESSMRGK